MEIGTSSKEYQDLSPAEQVAHRMMETEMTDDKLVKCINGDLILKVDEKELLLLIALTMERIANSLESIDKRNK